MIERHRRLRTLMCDDCDTAYDQVPKDEFTWMITAARSDGWDVRKGASGEFEHLCPDCQVADQGGGLAAQKRLFGL